MSLPTLSLLTMSEQFFRSQRREFLHLVGAGLTAGALSGAGLDRVLADEALLVSKKLTPVFESVLCPWTAENPRHDHQLLFPLSGDRVLLAWCEYYCDRPSLLTRKPTTKSGQAGDSMPCRISGRISTDRCRTWGARFTLQDNRWRNNVKHPNFLRLKNGEILFFFTGWESSDQRNVFLKRSSDEAESWSDVQQVSLPGWYCLNHGRVLQLKSGRIILPAHSAVDGSRLGAVERRSQTKLHAFVYYSDDGFRTWRQSDDTMTAPGRGAHEPSIVELKDGRLLCILRTAEGRLYQSFSSDEGIHWTTPEPTEHAAPDSEPLATRIPATGDLLLVWDNVASRRNWPRTPLAAAVSKDEGRTWSPACHLDDRPNRDAAYPHVFFQDKEAVVTYYSRPTSWARDCEANLKIFTVDQFYT